ncbi:MAG: ACP S-malonyltransferase [Fibrobacterota bacterium]
MSRPIFLLPGQGAHFPGMGRDMLDKSPSLFAEYLEAASDFSGYDLSELGTDMDEATFIQSSVIQPLISAVSLSYAHLAEKEGIIPQAVLGHSLGEITALGIARVLSPLKTIETAAFRGKLMDRCAQKTPGGMYVFMFVDADTIREEISRLHLEKDVYIANFNAPKQLVVSGRKKSCELLGRRLSEKTTCRTKPLRVNGPWHTPFLREARMEFARWAEDLPMHTADIPIILNATGETETRGDSIKKRITEQLISPVYWSLCLRQAITTYGYTTLYEIGPGNILQSTLRANGLKKQVTAYHALSSAEAILSFTTAQRSK